MQNKVEQSVMNIPLWPGIITSKLLESIQEIIGHQQIWPNSLLSLLIEILSFHITNLMNYNTVSHIRFSYIIYEIINNTSWSACIQPVGLPRLSKLGMTSIFN